MNKDEKIAEAGDKRKITGFIIFISIFTGIILMNLFQEQTLFIITLGCIIGSISCILILKNWNSLKDKIYFINTPSFRIIRLTIYIIAIAILYWINKNK